MYKLSVDILFLYLIWWIQSPIVVHCLLPYTVLNIFVPNTVLNAFHTCMSEICAVLS